MTRIIAGTAKGTRLTAPKTGTRPTSDRVREALFSTLATWFGTADLPAERHLAGVSVLDLYAGTGAVALEAASRGAAAVAVDSQTAPLIVANARRANLHITVRGSKAEARLPPGPFDLVFADPPYDVDSVALDQTLARLFSPGQLVSQALVVLERSTRSAAPTWPVGIDQEWSRGYGETTLYFAATPAGES